MSFGAGYDEVDSSVDVVKNVLILLTSNGCQLLFHLCLKIELRIYAKTFRRAMSHCLLRDSCCQVQIMLNSEFFKTLFAWEAAEELYRRIFAGTIRGHDPLWELYAGA